MEQKTWQLAQALDDAQTHKRSDRYLLETNGSLEVYAVIEYDEDLDDAWFFGYVDAGGQDPQAELTEHTEEMSAEIEALYHAYRDAGGADFETMLAASAVPYISFASSNEMGWAGVYFFDEEAMATGLQRHLRAHPDG